MAVEMTDIITRENFKLKVFSGEKGPGRQHQRVRRGMVAWGAVSFLARQSSKHTVFHRFQRDALQDCQ